MFTRLCQFFCLLNLALVRIKCTNLNVRPKTVYATGGKIAISCTDILDSHAASIEWIKLNTLSIISSDPQARVRRDGHRLLFDPSDYSDEGSYCCKPAAENHGCTYNSTVKIVIARAAVRAPAKNVISHSASGHNIVTKSSASGWRLEALPRTRCVLLGHSASINCLNNTHSFAEDIQWFKILSNGGLQLMPHSREARITSNAHQLQFKSTIAEDEGLYCCKTTNEIECSPTAVANVTISLPPVLSTLQNRTVLLGETIAINCTVNITMGESITFLWQKNGKDLPNESRYSTISSNNGITLIITNATAVDQGSFNCIAKNRKYQQNNQSMYLHVQNPLSCSDIDTSYSITVGLQSFIKNCSIVERAEMYNVINKFLQSICNCSDFCLSLDDINCSPDDTIITVVMTLKEKQSLFLRNLVYSTLQEGQVEVDQNYSMFCVVRTLCEKITPTSTSVSSKIQSTTVTNITTSSQVTEENNVTNLVIAVACSAVIVITLLILVLVIIVTIILRSRIHGQNKKLTVPHVTNPAHLTSRTTSNSEHPSTSSNDFGAYSLSDGNDTGPPARLTSNITASSEHPSTSSNDFGAYSLSDGNDTGPPARLTSRTTSSSEQPSTSSNDSGVYLLPDSNDSGPPVSDSTADDPFPPVTIDNSSTNHNVRTNPSFPAVRSTMSSSRAKDKKHKIIKQNKLNSVSKHQDVRLVNQPQNIRWKKNKTYGQVNLYSALKPSKPLAPMPDSKPPLHQYDDIEGINESRRRAAGIQIPCNTKHQTPTSPYITMHRSYASSVNSVTKSGNGANLLPTTNYTQV